MLISIEGNIGVGKSEFVRRLSKETEVTIVEEPLDEHKDLMVKYYNDPVRWAFPFQLAMLTSRAHIHYELQTKSNKNALVIERSIYTDYNIFSKLVVEAGYMTKWEQEKYNVMYNDLCYFVKKPDVFIYLDADIDFIMQRIKHRGREGEDNISADYVVKIKYLYDNWLNKECNVLKVYIDHDITNEDIKNIYFYATSMLDREASGVYAF